MLQTDGYQQDTISDRLSNGQLPLSPMTSHQSFSQTSLVPSGVSLSVSRLSENAAPLHTVVRLLSHQQHDECGKAAGWKVNINPSQAVLLPGCIAHCMLVRHRSWPFCLSRPSRKPRVTLPAVTVRSRGGTRDGGTCRCCGRQLAAGEVGDEGTCRCQSPGQLISKRGRESEARLAPPWPEQHRWPISAQDESG